MAYLRLARECKGIFMTIFSMFTNFSMAEGFGLNTNILETNIINLAVVLTIVITFVGDALRSLLENRKQTILNNFNEADQRANEAQEKLNQAKVQFDLAQKKAIQIREQGITTAEQEKNQTLRQTKEDIARLDQIKQETIQFQQQKAINEVSRQVVSLALIQVKDKLKNRLNSSFHASVNNFNIVLFTNYKVN
jgi:F-type H+-transporting ATPase subunit b